MAPTSERRAFDSILESILAGLPEDIRALLAEVPVIVEDEPAAELLAEMGIPESRHGSDLCGVHEQEPARIVLFRGPILRLAGRSRREREQQIRITLLHEIGHQFGLDEDRLEELGYG